MTPQSIAAQLRALAAQAENAEAAESRHAGPSNAKKLSPAEVRQLRIEYRRGSMNQRELADTYEVNPATVSRIVRGVYHANIR